MRIGDDLHVHTVLRVLPGVERAVGGDSVDRQQRSVEDHERFAGRRLHRGGQVRGECGQNVNGLGDVPVGGGGAADTEPGRELGVGVPAPQVGQRQQGLAAAAQTSPAGAASPAVGPQLSGQEAQGGTGQVDPRRIDKHAKPLVEMVLLVENSSTRGFTALSAQLAITSTRLEKAQFISPDTQTTSTTGQCRWPTSGALYRHSPVTTVAAPCPTYRATRTPGS